MEPRVIIERRITIQIKIKDLWRDNYNAEFNPLFLDWIDFYSVVTTLPESIFLNALLINATLFDARIKPPIETAQPPVIETQMP